MLRTLDRLYLLRDCAILDTERSGLSGLGVMCDQASHLSRTILRKESKQWAQGVSFHIAVGPPQ